MHQGCSRRTSSPSGRPYRAGGSRWPTERPSRFLADGVPRPLLDAGHGQGDPLVADPARRGRRRRRRARRRRRSSARSSIGARRLRRIGAAGDPTRASARGRRPVHGQRAVAADGAGRPAVAPAVPRDGRGDARRAAPRPPARHRRTASTAGSPRAGRSPGGATRSTPAIRQLDPDRAALAAGDAAGAGRRRAERAPDGVDRLGRAAAGQRRPAEGAVGVDGRPHAADDLPARRARGAGHGGQHRRERHRRSSPTTSTTSSSSSRGCTRRCRSSRADVTRASGSGRSSSPSALVAGAVAAAAQPCSTTTPTPADRDHDRADHRRRRPPAGELICITELGAVCRDLGAELPTSRVRSRTPATTLDALAALPDDAPRPLWLTIQPFPAMLDSLRAGERPRAVRRHGRAARRVAASAVATATDGRPTCAAAAPTSRCGAASVPTPATTGRPRPDAAAWRTIRPSLGDADAPGRRPGVVRRRRGRLLRRGPTSAARTGRTTRRSRPWVSRLLGQVDRLVAVRRDPAGDDGDRAPSPLDIAATTDAERARCRWGPVRGQLP